MSPTNMPRNALATNRPSQPEEVVAHHRDDNSDDTALVSLAGLEVEIELPKELMEPIEARTEAPGAMA